MADLVFRKSKLSDAFALAENLRPADLAELEAGHGRWLNVPQVLHRAIAMSNPCWTATEDGEPVMIFGAAPVSLLGHQGSVGSPWMLATPAVERHGKTLVKQGRRYVGEMHKYFDHLMNYVDTRNKTSKRWLRRIGFVLYPAEPHGQCGMPFHKFDRSACNV